MDHQSGQRSVTFTVWDVIENIETPDELTAVVTFKTPSASWFEAFTGTVNGNLIAAHAFNDEPKKENNPDYLLKPLGTGAFVITDSCPTTGLPWSNENYREANKPFFASINVKGGGDAPSAARSVLQTGDYDYAWNLQVEPAILLDLAGIDWGGQRRQPGRAGLGARQHR